VTIPNIVVMRNTGSWIQRLCEQITGSCGYAAYRIRSSTTCPVRNIILTTTMVNKLNDNSSGRSAIYRLPTRKLLAVDRIFICGFMSLISVITGNGNPLHFKSIFPVGKPTASCLLTTPKFLFCSRVPLTSSVVPASRL